MGSFFNNYDLYLFKAASEYINLFMTMSFGSKLVRSKKKHHSDSEEETSSREHVASSKDFGFDNYDEHVEDEEQDDIEHSKGDIVPPHLMMEHLNSLLNYLSSKNQVNVPFAKIKNKVDDWIATRKKEVEGPIDQEVLLKSLKQYLALSLRQSNLSLDNGIRCVRDYLDRGEAVLHYPDFPKKPPSLLVLYCKRNALPLGFGKLREAQERMREDHVGRQETEYELDLKEKSFLESVENFLDVHESDLHPKQKEFLGNKIKTLRRKIMGPQPRAIRTKSTTNGKRAKKDISAFDLFCSTKTDKYTDLEPEARVMKLQKKFNKLPDDKKEIFEKLALAK